MRILLATDGSRSADRARDLVASLPWPDGTHIRVVTSLEPRSEIIGTPWIIPPEPELDAMETQLVTHAQATLEDAERTLTGRGLRADSILLRSRAAGAIVAEATEWSADLVVLGNRGHGAISTMVLGSVSAEVVDRAPCPVLIVRDAMVDEIVLAADGSDGALLAEHVLSTWPVFRHVPVAAVTVTDTRMPYSGGLSAGMYDEVAASWVQDVEDARAGATAIAETTAERLRVAGIAAVAHVREGDPAHELVEFTRTRPHALLIVGTHGRTGLARLLLGSVARNVLTHSHGSVLVVRASAVVRPEAAARTLVGSA